MYWKYSLIRSPCFLLMESPQILLTLPRAYNFSALYFYVKFKYFSYKHVCETLAPFAVFGQSTCPWNWRMHNAHALNPELVTDNQNFERQPTPTISGRHPTTGTRQPAHDNRHTTTNNNEQQPTSNKRCPDNRHTTIIHPQQWATTTNDIQQPKSENRHTTTTNSQKQPKMSYQHTTVSSKRDCNALYLKLLTHNLHRTWEP